MNYEYYKRGIEEIVEFHDFLFTVYGVKTEEEFYFPSEAWREYEEYLKSPETYYTSLVTFNNLLDNANNSIEFARHFVYFLYEASFGRIPYTEYLAISDKGINLEEWKDFFEFPNGNSKWRKNLDLIFCNNAEIKQNIIWVLMACFYDEYIDDTETETEKHSYSLFIPDVKSIVLHAIITDVEDDTSFRMSSFYI